MEQENSQNAIFCDPNAFIQGAERKQPKKVVFAEPYDCLPTFYIDNNFKKHNCDCLPKPPKPPCAPPRPNCGGDCTKPPKFTDGFSLKSLAPILLGLLGKNGNTDITKLLSNFSPEQGTTGFDIQKIIGLVGQNPKILESVLSMFKGGGLGGLFKKKAKPTEQKAKQTDHIIKNYTRVE